MVGSKFSWKSSAWEIITHEFAVAGFLLIQRMNYACKRQQVRNVELTGLLGREHWFPVPVHGQIRISIGLQQPDEHFADYPASDRP
jgi:hypothetical protein